MKARTLYVLSGLFLGAMIFGRFASATNGTNGASGPALLDHDTDQLFDSQAPPHYLELPKATKTLTGHSTSTITQTDICTTAAGGGEIPCAGTDGKLSIDWLPTTVLTGTDVYVPWQQGSVRPGSGVNLSVLTGTGTGTKTSTWTGTATSTAASTTDTMTLALDTAVVTSIVTDKAASTDTRFGLVYAASGDGLDYLTSKISVGNGLYKNLAGAPPTQSVKLSEVIPSLQDVEYVVAPTLQETVGTFDYLGSGTYERKVVGSLVGTSYLEADIDEVLVGDRVGVLAPENEGPSSSGRPMNGVYTVIEAGDETHKFKIQRDWDLDSAEDFQDGSQFFVKRGAKYGSMRAVYKADGTPTLESDDLHFLYYVNWPTNEQISMVPDSEVGLFSDAAPGFCPQYEHTMGQFKVLSEEGWGRIGAYSLDFTTGEQADAMPTESHPGLVPILTGSTSNYLRADGQWAEPAGGGGSSSYVVAYEVDFSSLANQTISSDGAVTIDGLSYYAKNTANSQTFAVQNGSGVYIRCSAANSNDGVSIQTCPALGLSMANTHEDLRIGLTQDVWIMVQAVYSITPSANYERMEVGVAFGVTDSGEPTTNVRAIQLGIFNPAYYTYGHHVGLIVSGATYWYKGGWACTSGDPCTALTNPSVVDGYDVYAFHLTHESRVQAFRAKKVSGEWPTPAQITGGIYGTYMYTFESTEVSNGPMTYVYPMVYFATCSQGTSGNADILAQGMQVSYIKVGG